MYIFEHQAAAGSKITVTSTATKIFDLINTAASTTLLNAGFPTFANAIDITPEDGDIRILYDAGHVPTATNGFLLKSGTTYMLRGIPLSKMTLIRTSGNVVCSVLVGQSEPGENSSANSYEATSQTANSTTVTGFSNTLPMARYNATPTARTEGQFGNFQADANGNLNVNLATLLSGEDQTNTVMQTVLKPLSVSTYTPDKDVSASLEASSVTKASAGVLYGIPSFSNTNAAGRWLQFFDSTTVPADTAVPVLEYFVAAESTFPGILFPHGIPFSTGIAWCNSSTNGAKTVGSADSLALILYK